MLGRDAVSFRQLVDSAINPNFLGKNKFWIRSSENDLFIFLHEVTKQCFGGKKLVLSYFMHVPEKKAFLGLFSVGLFKL